MDFDVKLKDYPAQRIASIRAKTTLDKVPEKVRQLLTEVGEHLKAQGAEPAGQPLAIYYEVGSFLVDVEAGFPVRGDIRENDRVKTSDIPSGKAACTVYEGPHIKIPLAHRTVHKWMHENQIEASGVPPREVFLTDPRTLGEDDIFRAECAWPAKAPLSRAERRRLEREQQAQAELLRNARREHQHHQHKH